MMTIMTEVASKWDGLNKKQKAGLAEAISGKQQSAVFYSLMQNFDKVKKAQSDMNKGLSFNSANVENAKYVQSLAGQLNKLKEIWINVFRTLIDSKGFGGLLKGLIGISQAIETVIVTLDKAKMLTPVITALVGAFAVSKLKGIASFGTVLGGLSSAFGAFRIGAVGAAGAAGTVASSTALFMGPPTRGAAMLATGLTGLSTLATPLLILAGAIAVVAGASAAYEHFTTSTTEAATAIQKAIDKRQGEIKVIRDQKSALSGIQEEYDKLSSKPKKTADEVERLKELTNELVKIKPDLQIGTDEDNNAIIGYTGKVKDLIGELDELEKRKQKSQNVSKRELALNSMTQLNGKGTSGSGNLIGSQEKTLMNDLEKTTDNHVTRMGLLEGKRNKLINKMIGQTGIERQKTFAEVQKMDDKIFQEQNKFQKEYAKNLEVIKNRNAKVGTGIFADLSNNSAFINATKGKQNAFMELKKSLDFTDIRTEEQFIKVENGLAKVMKAASDGKINLTDLKKDLDSVNQEFAETGNLEQYQESMGTLAEKISNLSGVDKETILSLFEGIDTSASKSKTELDKFLAAYGKTTADINNNDGFAKALAEQRRQIEDGINDINEALSSEDVEVQKEVAIDLISNQDLPEELRDMIRVLMNKGANVAEVLQYAQELMIDISDGKINIEEANKEIAEKFGEGSFEITPEILMSPETKLAGIETVKKQLQDRFGEVPTVVKTIIETDGVTSYNEGKRILDLYNSFPEEVRTTIENNGLETTKDLDLIQQLYDKFPPEIATQLVNNFPDAIGKSQNYDELLSNLPEMVSTSLQVDGGASAQVINGVNESLEGLEVPREVQIAVATGLATGNIDIIESSISSLPKEKQVEVRAAISKALGDIGTVEATKIREKIAKVKGDTKPAITKLSQIEAIKIGVKTAKVTNPGGQAALDTIKGIHSQPSKKTFTFTTVMNTIKKIFTGGGTNPEGSSVGSQGSVAPQTAGIQGVGVQSQSASAPTGAVSAQASPSMSSSLPASSVMPGINLSVDLLTDLENKLKKVSNQLDIVNKKAENAFGDKKIKYLNDQNKLYKQQQQIQHEIANNLRVQQNELRYFLSQKGYAFDSDGSINNYQNSLLTIQKRIKAINDIKDDKVKKKYESELEQLERNKKLLEEYTDITINKLPQASNEWLELSYKINDSTDEIKKLKQEMIFEKVSNSVKEVEYALDRVNDRINLLDTANKFATGDDELKYLEQKIKLLEEQKKIQNDLYKTNNQKSAKYQDELWQYGFKMDKNSLITNYDEILNKLVGTKSYSDAKEVADAYMDIVRNLPDLKNESMDIDNSIKEIHDKMKDVREEQLRTTKEVQDKITEVYKKQVEERKKLLDKELDAKIKVLDKEKDAYNNYRKEVDYQRDFKDQKDTVDSLQNKVDIASRDTSLSGQKKLQDLIKQLEDAKEKLSDLNQSKIDEQVNNIFDSESERLKEELEKKKEDLDEKYSDENLQKLANSSLNSGVFVDLDGKVKNLKDTLVGFENQFGDGLSAIGGLIKSELISNLDIAKQSMIDMNKILGSLNLSSFSTGVGVNSASSYMPPSNYSSSVIQFNSPLIVVQGNVDKNVMKDLQAMSREIEKNVTANIVKNIK